MGIKGLWQALKPYVQDGHLGQFRGQRVAVDMYVWLHMAVKGHLVLNEARLAAYFAATDSASAESEQEISMEDVILICDEYIEYVVGKVEALQRFGVSPVCVFDGADIPMKRGTNEARRQGREACFKEAMVLLRENYNARGGRQHRADNGCDFNRYGDDYKKALEMLGRALNISTELAHPIIQVLREERHLECIVAPYEADAELAYLCRSGYVRAALSEDSDLIAYYCPCVIAKVDSFSGRCSVLQPSQAAPLFYQSMCSSGLSKKHSAATTLSAPGSAPPSPPPARATPFTYESFLLGCVMSGCDYVPNLHQIGVKTAFRLVSHAQTLPQLLTLLQTQFGFPPETVQTYRRHLLEAFYCFAHHIVYCPSQKKLMNLHPLPASVAGAAALKSELVGALWPADIAQKVCEECLFDPDTHQLYRGLYQNTLSAYLRRTRRGQVPLTSFSSFSAMSAGRVVIHSSPRAKRAREEPVSAPLHGELTKLREGNGFCGAGRGSADVTVVRSKYFVKADGRLGAYEDWSASLSSSCTSDTRETGDGERNAATGVEERGSGSSQATTCDTASTSACDEQSAARSRAAALSPLLLGAESPSTPPVATEQCATPRAGAASSLAPPPPPCRCPFGYVQCNTAHSVFVKCFVDKGWTRGAAPAPAAAPVMTTAAQVPSAPEAQGGRPCARAGPYRSPAFRPPRALRSGAAPPAAPAAGAAALFDQLAFKKA